MTATRNIFARSTSALITYRLPILSGILIGTSYIPFQPWALFFCLAPLFLFWRACQTGKQAFIGGWVTQFILNFIGFHWISHTAIEFGHFPVWLGALALLGFAAFAHLHYAISGLFTVWLSRLFNLRSSLFLALTVVVFALVEDRYPMVFRWHLGYPWIWAGWPGYQFTDVIGFDGLNIATIAINAIIASALWQISFIRRFAEQSFSQSNAAGLPSLADAVSGASRAPKVFERNKDFSEPGQGGVVAFALRLVVAAAIIAGLNFAGVGREEPWKNTDAEFNALAVQGNIGNFDKIMAEKGNNFRQPIIAKYTQMTTEAIQKAAEKPDIVIWPETAFPDLLDVPYQNDPNVQNLRSLVMTTNTPLLTGSYSYDAASKQTYNGFFFMNAQGVTPISPYRKSILLVFGETFPFADTIPYMDYLFPDQGSFGRGAGPMVMNVDMNQETLKLGPQICYEGLYPWFSASLAAQGAQVFSNVTNDSWFGRDFEPHQHLYMTFARAIEFRRPLLRSTNTGITTAILASGEILQKSPIGEEWTGMFKIRYMTEPAHTIYEKIAGKWVWALVFALVVLLAFGRGARTNL